MGSRSNYESKYKNDKIFVIDKCTYCNKGVYESFRRDGDAAGRMYALLGWLK